MRTPVLAVLCSLAFGFSACAQLEKLDKQATAAQPQIPLRCDDAVAQGAGPGKGSATAIAEHSMRLQFADVRGYLLSQGFRRIRTAGRFTQCQQHGLIAGWVECTAVTRFCGR